MRNLLQTLYWRGSLPLGVVLLIVFCGVFGSAQAHFLLNLNVRIFHVEHFADGLKVYMRTPMPYLVADRVGPVGADSLPQPAPYTSNAKENGKLVHFVDPDQLRRDQKGLGLFAGEGIHFIAGGKSLDAIIEQVRVYRIGNEPGFATLEEAEAAFATNNSFPDNSGPLYVGDAVVDIVLRYRTAAPIYDYTVSSTLDPGLPGQEKTANLILDYGPGSTEVYRARGLLSEPVEISRSRFSAVLTFVKSGVRHILEGLDHVLFVLCLIIGATQLNALVWRVTGFTIGHTVTLSAGFFGFVPSGAWFVPTVEAGIALSIIYAAVIAIRPRSEQRGGEQSLFFITFAIGLLHGLGFSFVLHNILQVTSPDVWQSLLGFNVGVEIGQLLIILIVWPVFRLIEYLNKRAWRFATWGVACSCMVIAGIWTVQRAASIIDTL